MSRHQRANSDLYGIKTAKTISNNSSKYIQNSTFNMGLMSEKQKSFKSKKTDSTESSNKKEDANQLILDTYRLAKHFYHDQDEDYLHKVRNYLHGQWQTQRKNFIQHLNKLEFMQDDMQKKDFHEIQLDIMQEWRRNPVLYYLRALWYEHIGSKFIESIDQFMGKYNLFREFVGQVAFLYFKTFFSRADPKKSGLQKYLTKLVERTSHFIITHTSSWSKICDRCIIPLIKDRVTLKNEQKQRLRKIREGSVQELKLNTIIIDYKSEGIQLPKTIDAIQKFILEHKLLEKIKLILDIRKILDEEIRRRQQLLVQQKILKEIKVLDKDDFLDCIVYCIIKGDICLESLIVSIKFVNYFFGCDTNAILSKFRCDAYLTDLEVAANFLASDQSEV